MYNQYECVETLERWLKEAKKRGEVRIRIICSTFNVPHSWCRTDNTGLPREARVSEITTQD